MEEGKAVTLACTVKKTKQKCIDPTSCSLRTCMLLSKLMAPSGPCSSGIPKAEAWTGGRRIEPAPIPTMLWRPVRPGRSPTEQNSHIHVCCYRVPAVFKA